MLEQRSCEAYAPYPMTDAEFDWLIGRSSTATHSLELCQGRLYTIADERRIAQRSLLLSRLLEGVLPSTRWWVKASPGRIRCDPHNLLMPDLVVARGGPSDRPTNIALVVEYERSGGYKRALHGRNMYLDKGVYAHWLINLEHNWVEVTRRGNYADLYNVPSDVVPLILDDVVMGEFGLDGLIE